MGLAPLLISLGVLAAVAFDRPTREGRVTARIGRRGGPLVRLSKWISRRRFGGTVPEPLALMAHRPLLLHAYSGLELAFERSRNTPGHLRARRPSLGGRDSDLVLLGVLALVAVAGAWATCGRAAAVQLRDQQLLVQSADEVAQRLGPRLDQLYHLIRLDLAGEPLGQNVDLLLDELLERALVAEGVVDGKADPLLVAAGPEVEIASTISTSLCE